MKTFHQLMAERMMTPEQRKAQAEREAKKRHVSMERYRELMEKLNGKQNKKSETLDGGVLAFF